MINAHTITKDSRGRMLERFPGCTLQRANQLILLNVPSHSRRAGQVGDNHTSY